MNGAGGVLTLVGIAVLAAGLAADVPSRARARLTRLALPHERGALRRALAGFALGAALAAAAWFALALPVASVLGALAGAAFPFARRRAQAAREARELERGWSAALDQLADGLEAGLAFPAACALVAESGPAPLRARFALLKARIREGELERGLDELADGSGPGARPVAALLRAALVELPTGGLAPLLRELARVARERFEAAERARGRALALRREAAILAASPVAFLALIGWSAPGYLDAYRTPGGTVVSLAGALVIGGCYLAMLRLGRVPAPGAGAAR